MNLQTQQKGDEVPGLERAVARFGEPVYRCYQYDVTHDTILYWQMVTRKRRAEVVLALQRGTDRYVLHTKEFYPRGTYRLLTGGIKLGEDLLAAVEREAVEETGLDVSIDRFLAVLDYRFRHDGQTVDFRSYVFSLSDSGGAIHANDTEEGISGYREVAAKDLVQTAEALERLPADWIDWGRFRAVAHRVTWEILGSCDE